MLKMLFSYLLEIKLKKIVSKTLLDFEIMNVFQYPIIFGSWLWLV